MLSGRLTEGTPTHRVRGTERWRLGVGYGLPAIALERTEYVTERAYRYRHQHQLYDGRRRVRKQRVKRVGERCASDADEERVSAAREVPYPAVERPVRSPLLARICISVAANLYRLAIGSVGGRPIQPQVPQPNASLRRARSVPVPSLPTTAGATRSQYLGSAPTSA